MARFIEGEDRRRVALLPECLDDHVGEDSSVIDSDRGFTRGRKSRGH